MKAWARAHLQRGSSAGQIWEIDSEYPEARLTLGVASNAGWVIEANGVKPIHCELFWDGQALWVADIQNAGGVFLDGTRVRDWTQIEGPAELRFGQAALDIETSAPVSQQMHSRPELAKPMTVTDIGISLASSRGSTPSGSAMFGGAAGDQSVPDLDQEKTRLAAAPGMKAEPMRIGVPAPPPPGISQDLRPRLGGSSPEPSSAPHSGAATRMVALPGAQPRPHAPAIGGAPRPQLGGGPAPVSAPPPPPPAGRVPPPPNRSAPPAPPAPPQAAPQAPAGGFAPPPAIDAEAKPDKPGLLARLFGDKKKAADAKEEGSKQSLPTRTWILLSVTVVAAMALLLWEEEPPPAPAPAPSNGELVDVTNPGQTPEAETPEAETPEAETPEQETPDVEPVATGVTEVEEPDPSTDGDGESEGPVLVNEEGVSWQRVAVDAYMAGRYEDSLAAYRRLVTLVPDDPSYPAMVRVLERRLEASTNE